MCAFLIPHRSTNTAILSLQGMQFQGTRWGRLWTQPWGDQLLSEGTRWLSPRWRGKSSSLSVLVVNKLEVLYQPLRALHHDESECYKVLIIKTCQCVCVFSKALVVVPVWNHDGTTASFSEVLWGHDPAWSDCNGPSIKFRGVCMIMSWAVFQKLDLSASAYRDI